MQRHRPQGRSALCATLTQAERVPVCPPASSVEALHFGETYWVPTRLI